VDTPGEINGGKLRAARLWGLHVVFSCRFKFPMKLGAPFLFHPLTDPTARMDYGYALYVEKTKLQIN